MELSLKSEVKRVANAKNLKPKAHSLTVEEQSKGGKKSGAARRTNADIRKMLNAALFEEYTDKHTGKKIEGIQGIVNALIVKSLNGKDKDQLAAIKYIFNLLGLDKSEIEEEKNKAEIELIRARVMQIASGQGNGAVDDETRKQVEDIISEFSGTGAGEPVDGK